jgi:hypothetical protein
LLDYCCCVVVEHVYSLAAPSLGLLNCWLGRTPTRCARLPPQGCDPAPFYLFDEIDAALDPQYRWG